MSSVRNAARLEALDRKLKALKAPAGSAQVDFSAYRDDPVGFAKDILGITSATRRSDGTPYQFEVLQAVKDHPRVAIRSGHGVGKTASLAMLSHWWLITRPMSRVVIVAPQYDRQVRGIIFGELRKQARRAKVPLPIEVLQGKASITDYGSEWGMIGLPATEPDRIEGQHAEGGLLLLVDETKGVPQDSYDALQGALSGGEESRLVVASTPGGASGPFYRACTSQAGAWKVVHLSSEDSSLVSPKWCRERAEEWGIESQLYVSRVKGEFADSGEGQLFGLTLLEQSFSPLPDSPGAAVVFGIDVSRSVAGDMNCICVARGGRVERFVLWRSPDLMATVARVVHEVLASRPSRIRIDAGGVGAGVVDRLKQLHFRVEGVHFGGAASDPSRFRNARAEMFWQLREGLERRTVSLPDDDDLCADLTALRYQFTQSGQVLLESKDEARRRLGRSPDRADALALATSAKAIRQHIPLAPPFTIPIQTPHFLRTDTLTSNDDDY